tara:strand:+ start:211 stop:855 length:645 start_codon:yes stop_codon:yes gene_type:complete
MTIHFGDGSTLTAAPSGGASGQQVVRAFGSNTQYTPTSGTKSITVYCVAGGGGGGDAYGDDSGEQSDFAAGAGGGGGGACIGHYNLGSGFSATVQIGGGGAGNNGGGESKWTPAGQYTGDGTLDATGGQEANTGNNFGGNGGGATGGFALTGQKGNNRSTSSSGGQYYQVPGNGGHAAFSFGIFGRGGHGTGPTGSFSEGGSGQNGIIVVYEFL